MPVEEELKSLIIKRFKSVRSFAIAIEKPCSSINNIFSRGISGAAISTIIPVCRALDLDVDALADGEIKFNTTFGEDVTLDEKPLLAIYRGFNQEGKAKVREYAEDLSTNERYKKPLDISCEA